MPPEPTEPVAQAPLPRILHIDLERGWRGGQQQVAYLVAQLQALGLPCTLACRAGEPLHRCAQAEGWPVVPLRSLAHGAWALSGLVRRKGVGIVHAHSARSQNLGLLLKLRHPGLRLVVSRRVDFHRHPGALSGWKYRTALVSRWLAVSDKVRTVLLADGVPAGRIAVVHSGVDVARFQAPAEPAALAALRTELGLTAEDFVVGHVGALVPHKDQATLLRAFALAARERPGLRLLIAGEGELRPGLEALAAELGIGERVRMPGFRDDLPRLLHLFDLFVMSSQEEGLGTSVLDAMAAGRAVVVTDAGGLPEMVQPERNGLLVPRRDPEALAAAIGRLADDVALRAACAAHNREDVARFSARATAEKTLAVYRALK